MSMMSNCNSPSGMIDGDMLIACIASVIRISFRVNQLGRNQIQIPDESRYLISSTHIVNNKYTGCGDPL